MSPEKIIQMKITEEINLIPEENSQELYEFIHEVCGELAEYSS